jgi:SET domain-containing protein
MTKPGDLQTKKTMYKPLPDSLTIKESKVNGLGLFAKEGIAQGTNLGMSHVLIGSGIIRTPMGGFINHSNDANTVKVELKINGEDDPLLKVATKKWNLVTLRDIKEGEEVTVRYTFYSI